MPPMPGSIARGRFLKSLRDIANNTSLPGLIQIRESLVSGAQHVDNLRKLSPLTSLGERDLDHLTRHWFGNDEQRWWRDQPTSEIIRYAEIRALDLIIEARSSGQTTYVDCVWICRGTTVEVATTRNEINGMVFITFMVLTPPIPSDDQIQADAGADYAVSENIWITAGREAVLAGGRLKPGFRQDGKEPPSERESPVRTVELLTVADDAQPRFAAPQYGGGAPRG